MKPNQIVFTICDAAMNLPANIASRNNGQNNVNCMTASRGNPNNFGYSQ